MSDATERPADRTEMDADAWARACAEDLAAERARQAGRDREPGSAAEELRKLAQAVTDKLGGLPLSGAGAAAQGALGQLIEQAKNAVEPVVERNPDVFDHLAAAGNELLAAYRAAVESGERQWTRGAADGRDATGRGNHGDPADRDPRDTTRGDDEGPAGTERIDLD